MSIMREQATRSPARHLVVREGREKPAVEGHAFQAVQNRHKLDPPIHNAIPLEAFQLQHAAEVEVRGVECPPGPPDEGDPAPLEVGVPDVRGVL